MGKTWGKKRCMTFWVFGHCGGVFEKGLKGRGGDGDR